MIILCFKSYLFLTKNQFRHRVIGFDAPNLCLNISFVLSFNCLTKHILQFWFQFREDVKSLPHLRFLITERRRLESHMIARPADQACHTYDFPFDAFDFWIINNDKIISFSVKI